MLKTLRGILHWVKHEILTVPRDSSPGPTASPAPLPQPPAALCSLCCTRGSSHPTCPHCIARPEVEPWRLERRWGSVLGGPLLRGLLDFLWGNSYSFKE